MANEPGFTPVTTTGQATPGFTPVDEVHTSDMPAGSYQLRKGGPVLDPNKSVLRTGVESLGHSLGIDKPTSAADAAQQFGRGVKGFAKQSWEELKPGGWSDPLAVPKALVYPFHMAARGIEGMASGIESGASDIEKGMIGPSGGTDWRSIAAGLGTLTGTKLQQEAPEHVMRAFHTAAALIEKQPTIEQGKIAYVNTARAAATKLENAVTSRGVGARVKAVTDADTLDLQRTGSPGGVHTADAQAAGIKAEAETKIPGNLYNYPAQMTLDQAKAQLTLMGRDAARMERAGKSPEAKAVWAQYDALRDATQARAEELGKQASQPFGKNWSDYSTEFKNFLKLHEGVLGHLMEGEHTAALDKLIKHSGQLPELKDWFDKYNVDMKPIEDAASEGKKLTDLTQTNSNAVMGKIKLLSRHWALMTPALIGAQEGFKAAGVTGGLGGFILPLIVAGKIAGLLDKIQVKELLQDLKNKVQPEQFRVAPGPVGPLEQLHRTASAGPMAPEEDAMEQARRRAPGEPPTEPTPASAKEATDVEAAKRRQATSEAAMSKADVAKKVAEARGSRAQSGVYKGKR